MSGIRQNIVFMWSHLPFVERAFRNNNYIAGLHLLCRETQFIEQGLVTGQHVAADSHQDDTDFQLIQIQLSNQVSVYGDKDGNFS